IHAQERAIPVAFEEIARPFAITSSYDAGDHGFRTLEPPRSLKLLKVFVEDRLEPDRRHVLLPTSEADCTMQFGSKPSQSWTQACSMSLVIVPRLNSGDPIPSGRRGIRRVRLIPGNRLPRRFGVECDPTVQRGVAPIKQKPGI